jgi:hypothetical protein
LKEFSAAYFAIDLICHLVSWLCLWIGNTLQCKNSII